MSFGDSPCDDTCDELYTSRQQSSEQCLTATPFPTPFQAEDSTSYASPSVARSAQRLSKQPLQPSPSLPCLARNDSYAKAPACNPCPLRPSSVPPKTYPNIPAQYLSHLFLIGAGQSGKIHLLTPTTALKLPMEQHLIDLENERDIYSRISVFQHPSILNFLGTLHNGIVLSYHPLGSLRIFIHGATDSGLGVTDDHVQLLEKSRMKWALQITEGVQFLHQNGIVHCDISSANTLITSAQNVVLCDFSSSMMDGVAKGGKTRCSRWYKFVQEEGGDSLGEGRQYGVQDDLWAVGTVCYEMWARRRLWGNFQEVERVRLYREGNWPCLEGLGLMGSVIAKCWADGYRCAGELLSDVNDVNNFAQNDESKAEEAPEEEQEGNAWEAID